MDLEILRHSLSGRLWDHISLFIIQTLLGLRRRQFPQLC